MTGRGPPLSLSTQLLHNTKISLLFRYKVIDFTISAWYNKSKKSWRFNVKNTLHSPPRRADAEGGFCEAKAMSSLASFRDSEYTHTPSSLKKAICSRLFHVMSLRSRKAASCRINVKNNRCIMYILRA